MSNDTVELTFVFKNGHERKYRVLADAEVTDASMRATIGGIMQLLAGKDYPILTDWKGRVFCLPNQEEIIAIDCEKV
jgi:hypothetical protein